MPDTIHETAEVRVRDSEAGQAHDISVPKNSLEEIMTGASSIESVRIEVPGEQSTNTEKSC